MFTFFKKLVKLGSEEVIVLKGSKEPYKTFQKHSEEMRKIEVNRNLRRMQKQRPIPFPDIELPSPVPRKLWMDQLYSSQIEHLLESMGVSNGQGRGLR